VVRYPFAASASWISWKRLGGDGTVALTGTRAVDRLVCGNAKKELRRRKGMRYFIG
jgi:hypothetical protein